MTGDGSIQEQLIRLTSHFESLRLTAVAQRTNRSCVKYSHKFELVETDETDETLWIRVVQTTNRSVIAPRSL